MPETISLLLSGGRGQWPNIWSILAFEPDKVYILPPTGDEANTSRLSRWLDKRSTTYSTLEAVDPSDSVGAEQICTQVLNAHPDARILINLTQAPKMTAIGASFAAVLSGRSDVCAYHCDTATRKINPACGVVPNFGDVKPTIDDYLAAYGRDGFDMFYADVFNCTEASLGAVARSLAHHVQPLNSMLDWLRRPVHSAVQKGVQRAEVDASEWRREWAPLLISMQAAGLIKDYDEDKLWFRLSSANEWQFLNGTWLELYARDEARKCVDLDFNGPLFTDCRMSVAIDADATSNEIDLACIDRAGFLLFASCKSSKESKSDMLNEITDRSKLLGDNYCAKVFITSRPWADVPASIHEQAAERRIAVITGENLPKITHHLQEAMIRARRTAR